MRSALLAGVAAATLLAAPRVAEACFWYYGTDLRGREVEVGGVHGTNPQHYVAWLLDHTEHQQRAAAPLPPEPPPTADFKVRSDHAASLVYHGKVREAVALFEAIELAHPGEYVVAANLGTAYELASDDQQALRWIQEGLRRNPDSHEGTEWLHVRILEAKLALARDPAWLSTHSVLGVDFGDKLVPAAPASWTAERERALTALEYQLHERTGFVPPPDAVVADLLFDLGNVLAITRTVEHAGAVYEVARRYGTVHGELAERRRAHFAELAESRRLRATLWRWGIVALALAGAVALVWGLRRLRRRRRA